jgi:hypothetical protein
MPRYRRNKAELQICGETIESLERALSRQSGKIPDSYEEAGDIINEIDSLLEERAVLLGHIPETAAWPARIATASERGRK